MNCPVCNLALTMTERQGVEIDYCPKCRGVWLDRGELDKIIERSAVGTDAPQQFQGGTQYNPPPNTQYNPPRESHHDSHHDNRGHYENQHHYKQHDDHKYKKKKKESFLGELFDF